MKLLIASDLHGSAFYAEKLEERMRIEQADKLLFMGDVLYHGPRNPLPDKYNPKEVIQILTRMKDKIVAVRGNCDSEVDQMVLPFPIMADYALFCIDELTLFLTHGHVFSPESPPPQKFDVLICGHTHIGALEQKNDFLYLNPGSLSLPKDGTNSYAIYKDNCFTRKNMAGEVIEKRKFCR